MTRFGYHASQEQFAPSQLLGWVQAAETAGFDCAKSSDHFHPWSERQGQSGFTFAWLGAALQSTRFPFGTITAPGYRYHPAIIAQAIATLGEMFPGRLWVALGSGEAINEAITGEYWPDKPARNARLAECFEVIRALLAGETLTHRGRVTVVEAKLYTRPEQPVPLYIAATSAATARRFGAVADGLVTTGGDLEATRTVIEAFRENGGGGKPIIVQSAHCWSRSRPAAVAEAIHQWAPCAIGGEVNWDLRRPADFDLASKLVDADEIAKAVRISDSTDQHVQWLGELAALGADEVHIHQVGRNQPEFIGVFGADVLPQLRTRN